jgi:hypothetical protein
MRDISVQAPEADSSKQKAGRGSNTKSNVMIMAKSTILENIETGKIDRQCRYFKAKVLENHKAGGTDDVLKNAIEGETCIVFSDKSTSYLNIEDSAKSTKSIGSNLDSLFGVLVLISWSLFNASPTRFRRRFLQ